MATLHIPESEAAHNFAALMDRVRAGEEIAIESDSGPVVLLTASPTLHLTLQERIALLPEDSAVMDDDFARDVAAAVEAHREPLDPPAWD